MRTLILTLTMTALAATAGAQTIGQRERNQQQRIGQGVRSGSLTPAETVRLEREEARNKAKVRRDRVDGGGMTAAERARAQNRLDRTSRDIARMKHNDRGR
ncbi:hypothetical protein [uncultured Paludibaculum sp.]|uniref:hypothetical protein n=1 Tax=uncultured Paludibaculum sp. TaxID=1765020 RepID=UPI002AAC2573|nr:hypothetical protein [uncultured Paludibaculum sp.]